MARSNLPRLRKICLALPEAVEVESWGAPTFRVGKIFVMFAANAEEGNHAGRGREGAWVKTDHFNQDLLVHAQPTRYFVPPYVGPSGWTGVYLDADTDWIALTDLVEDAYRATAPKRLSQLVSDEPFEPKGVPRSVPKGVPKSVPRGVGKRPAAKRSVTKRSATKRPATKRPAAAKRKKK